MGANNVRDASAEDSIDVAAENALRVAGNLKDASRFGLNDKQDPVRLD
jgi:hypothetical protein